MTRNGTLATTKSIIHPRVSTGRKELHAIFETFGNRGDASIMIERDRIWIVNAPVTLSRHDSVHAPVADECAALRIHDRNAMIQVICDEYTTTAREECAWLGVLARKRTSLAEVFCRTASEVRDAMQSMLCRVAPPQVSKFIKRNASWSRARMSRDDCIVGRRKIENEHFTETIVSDCYKCA